MNNILQKIKNQIIDKWAIIILTIIVSGSIIFITLLVLNFYLTSKNEFKDISTENIYKIWKETSLLTGMHGEAYQELEKRGYWTEERTKRNQEAIEIYNKYK